MKTIVMNPKSDPRRAEYWEGKQLQLDRGTFIKSFKSLISETEELEQLHDVSQVLTAAHKVTFSQSTMNDRLILGIGSQVDGGEWVWSAYYNLSIIGQCGESMFTTSRGYSLGDDFHYPGNYDNTWDQLYPPIIAEIEKFLEANPEFETIGPEEISYDPNYDEASKGLFNYINDKQELDKVEKEWITRMSYPNVEGFKESGDDLILRIDTNGNFIASSKVEWGSGDICRVTAEALAKMHSI